MSNPSPPSVPGRQEPLRRRYREDPQAARIVDHARAVVGGGTDPFHGEIEPANAGGARWPYGMHRAVGGDHDAPNPGDLLSSALAACLHSTTRMLAQWLDVRVDDVEVTVTAEADVRGTLMVDRSVPVGFERMRCDVYLKVPAETQGQKLKTLTESAERSCVVMQTLGSGIEIDTDWRIDQEIHPANAPKGN